MGMMRSAFCQHAKNSISDKNHGRPFLVYSILDLGHLLSSMASIFMCLEDILAKISEAESYNRITKATTDGENCHFVCIKA